jgi:predicted alpha/beta superfamily hydrolase
MVPDSSGFDLPLPDGRICQARVALPATPVPAGGWPVAYVLDLAQHGTMCADTAALPGILVGIGSGVPQDRRLDYVPARWAAEDRRVGRSDSAAMEPPTWRTGAARWLRTLDAVRARIAAEYPLDPRRQVLCGHSLGGLFAWYVLLHRPRAFDGYVISSPSVWWGGGYAARLLRRRQAWLCRAGLPPLGVSLTVGEYEQGLGPDDAGASPEERARRQAVRQARGMVDGARALADGLSRCPGLRLRHQVLSGRGHHTAAQAALRPGWQWLLQG